MVVAVRLGLMPRSWLQEAVPPHVTLKNHPHRCDHQNIKRHGNAHGRFALCQDCGMKWKWDNNLEKWVDFHGSRSSSTRLLPLPSPSSIATRPRRPPNPRSRPWQRAERFWRWKSSTSRSPRPRSHRLAWQLSWSLLPRRCCCPSWITATSIWFPPWPRKRFDRWGKTWSTTWTPTSSRTSRTSRGSWKPAGGQQKFSETAIVKAKCLTSQSTRRRTRRPTIGGW